MLWIPQKGIKRVQTNTGDVATVAPGTSVSTGTPATSKGTAVELITSTDFDAYWVQILASDYGSAGAISHGCLDILIGAATEEVLIPDLLMGHCGYYSNATVGHAPKRWDFPLYIPAGTRIAAQAAGARTSTAFRVQIFLYGGDATPSRLGTKVTTYGMGTIPRGTSITPGTSGAAGSWTQITASTTEDHFAFVPSFQVATDLTTSNLAYTVEMGIGAATEEKIGQTYWYGTDTQERMAGPINSYPSFADVPSGTRLVMRASNSGANDAAYDGVIHAVS